MAAPARDYYTRVQTEEERLVLGGGLNCFKADSKYRSKHLKNSVSCGPPLASNFKAVSLALRSLKLSAVVLVSDT